MSVTNMSSVRSSRSRPPRQAAGALALALLLSACGGGKDDAAKSDSSTTTTPDEVQAQVASYDLAVGPPSRFIVGIYNEKRGPVGFGTVPMRFFFLSKDQPTGTAAPQPGPVATASYLPLPGSAPAPGDTSKPAYLATDQRGVYAAQVAFDRPGYWGVEATVDLDGPKTIKKGFKVLPAHEVPAVGDAAVASQNLTVAQAATSPAAVDSRASASAPVPDAELHQSTVAQAMAEKRPVVLVIATPTYCESLFCGPVTDMVAGLTKDYPDRARYIHVEVWKNYEAQELNDAAREWIARGEGATEPWVFLIGADGKVSLRLDNVATRQELEPHLRGLPAVAA